ncbi:MAG: hypothetical protein NTY01_17680 [Verrucomicrobia bacterium]|nr:hypothetical protein [Verrucomicrobiota bacterium]
MTEVNILETVSKAVKALPRTLALVPLCAAVMALLVASPLWPPRADLEPQNPMIVVDLKSFGASLVKGSVPSSTLTNLNKTLGLNCTNESRALIFSREWYYIARDWPRPAGKSGGKEITAEYFNNKGPLKQVKGWLGIDDEDTRREGLGRLSHRYENAWSLDELIMFPMPLHHCFFPFFNRNELDKVFGSASVSYIGDPFYRVFEEVKDDAQRCWLYRCLSDASTIYSWWILRNKSSKDIYGVRISADLFHYEQVTIEDSFLNGYDITKEREESGRVILRVNNLAPGAKNYKVLVFRTHHTPIASQDVRLDKANVLDETTEYYRWWLGLPIALVIIEMIVCIRLNAITRRQASITSEQHRESL